MKTKALEKNLTQGSVARQLLAFAAPFILSNFIQSLYSVADMIIVGQFAGVASMSGVNNGTQLTMLITNAVIGLTVGATVLIGQYLGAGKRDDIRKVTGTLFTVLVIAAGIVMALTPFLTTPLVNMINPPAEAVEETRVYFFVCMMGTLFVFVYNALAAVMRGMGDSFHPLVFVGIACVVNIVLDLLAVGMLHMGALGAALATIISQAVSAIICIFYWKKHDFAFDFRLRSFRIDTAKVKLFFKIGVPTMLNNICTSVSFIFITRLANAISTEASAAVGAVAKYNGFAILPAIAISSAISAMVAQNFAAGKLKRAQKTMYVGMALSFGMSVVFFALIMLFPTQILRVFADSEEMANCGVEYIRSFSFDYLIVSFFFSLNGMFIGTGHSLISFVTGICSSLLFRIAASWFFGVYLDKGLFGIGLGAPIASAAALVMISVCYFTGMWKKQTVIHDSERIVSDDMD